MNKLFRHTVLGMAIVFSSVISAGAAETLPNFVPLVKSAGPAVVNISTEREVVSRMGGLFGEMPPGMERFFEQ